MKKKPPSTKDSHRLSRRERQILDILYMFGRASAAQVQSHLPDPPGYPAVRKWLFLMEKKGLITHTKEGRRYVFEPTVPHEEASREARNHLVETFFEGSRLKAAAALLADRRSGLSTSGVKLMRELIEQAQKQGK